MQDYKLLLAELYAAYFNRAPDAEGLAYWLNELENGVMTFDQIASNWANEQEEFTDTYGEDVDNDAFIAQVYANVLGREPDAEGLAYWKAELQNGNIPKDQFIQAIVNGAKAPTGSASDAALLNNKAKVGIKVADSGINDVDFAKKAVAAVSADASTVEIVSNLVDMGKDDAEALQEAAATLVEVQALIVANVSADVLENVKSIIESVAEKHATGEVADIKASLSAVTSTVAAAKVDASFVKDPAKLADSISSTPTTVVEEANTIIPVDEETTPEPDPAPAPAPAPGGGGGTYTPPPAPAPTFTAKFEKDNYDLNDRSIVTFSGTATGDITFAISGDPDSDDPVTVTFTRQGLSLPIEIMPTLFPDCSWQKIKC